MDAWRKAKRRGVERAEFGGLIMLAARRVINMAKLANILLVFILCRKPMSCTFQCSLTKRAYYIAVSLFSTAALCTLRYLGFWRLGVAPYRRHRYILPSEVIIRQILNMIFQETSKFSNNKFKIASFVPKVPCMVSFVLRIPPQCICQENIQIH